MSRTVKVSHEQNTGLFFRQRIVAVGSPVINLAGTQSGREYRILRRLCTENMLLQPLHLLPERLLLVLPPSQMYIIKPINMFLKFH